MPSHFQKNLRISKRITETLVKRNADSRHLEYTDSDTINTPITQEQLMLLSYIAPYKTILNGDDLWTRLIYTSIFSNSYQVLDTTYTPNTHILIILSFDDHNTHSSTIN